MTNVSIKYHSLKYQSRVTSGLVILMAAALSLIGLANPVASAATRPLAKYEPANGKAYIGVSTPKPIKSFSKLVNIKQPAIYNGYTSANGTFDSTLAAAKAVPGVTPMISWDVPFTNASVTTGHDDAYLAGQAAKAKAYGKPIFIRLDWEMNANWYPQYASSGGVTPTQFIASWDRVRAIFAKVGATNVAWVWCPAAFTPNTAHMPAIDWYPGDNEVDWISLDVYPQYANTTALAVTAPGGMDAFAHLAADHNKPLMVAEWARGSQYRAVPDTSQVFDVMFDWAERFPDTVKALVYFDYTNNGHDLETHPVGRASFIQHIHKPRYVFTGPTQ